MAPTSNKRLIQQQVHNQSNSQAPSVVLKEGVVSGGVDIANFGEAQAYVHNALNQSHGLGHGHNNNHHHSHGRHHHQHSKENANSQGSKKGLEILDFHESWREELENYKDVMYAHKHAPTQLLLGSHNHAHTPQGHKLDMVVNNVSANKLSHLMKQKQHNNSTEYATHAINTTSSEATGQPKNGSSYQEYPKRTITSENNKTRVRVATTMAEAETAAIKDDNQLHLKRQRLEATSKTVGSDGKSSSPRNAKRSGNASSHSNGLISKSAAASNNQITSSSSTSPSPPKTSTNKIIVNQFHASSFLNGHRFEKKEQILTQNGLTNASATAYEASFYAANYLTADARNNSNSNYMHGMNGSTRGNNSNYVGVSLAQIANDAHHTTNGLVEDDPCSAIDDVDTYSDSDSEDEYIGHPFYLREDDIENNQSKKFHEKSSVTEDANKDCKESPSVQSSYITPTCILSPSLFPNVPPYLNFSSHSQPGPPMPAQLKKILKWKLSPVMPKIVKRVVLNSGFRIIKNTTDWMAVWEKHMKSPGFRTIRSHQKYNHMPGSFRIGRKDSMWRSIQQNMKKFGSKEFGFMQKSYVLPDDLENLRQVWPKNVSKLTKWIVKPPASARGTGISIVNKWSQFPKDRPLVVQKYIERPLLINDNKFDMRIYVVLTSINPLRIYMYKDGLARFASVKYSSELNSLDQRCMHLTNYSINKFSENYTKNEDVNACQGHKWTLQSLWCRLESRGVNTKRLWATLRNLVIKAIISGESGLNRTYRQNVNFRYNCFELFGFDVLLDENLIPWLLEINISPSLHSELPLDLHVKGPLIQTILNTALYQVPPKLNEKQQKDILEELNLDGPLCHDKRIFTTCLRVDEIRKHNHFTNRSVEYREEYLDAILDNLHPDDVRCLIITEDELNRCKPLERIFPTPDTHEYLQFIEHPRYYNRLLDAWENRYGHCREKGIELLRKLCKDNVHLQVADAALEKEPDVTVTEIDMLHLKKDDAVDLLSADVKSYDTDDTTTQSSQPTYNTTTNDNENDTAANNKLKIKAKALKTKIKTIVSTVKSKTDLKAS